MLKIVPPKQNGHNCGLVALCHAANYFQADFDAQLYQHISDLIEQQQGFTLANAVAYLPALLKDASFTFLIHQNNKDQVAGSSTPRIKYVVTAGHESFTLDPFQAAIVCWEELNDVWHISFELDRYSIDRNIGWAVFISDPACM